MGNEMKHTPGPWSLERASYGLDVRGNGVWLASVLNNHSDAGEPHNEGFPTDEACEANARLIAAAPETAAERDALRALVKGIQDALGTGEEGENLVAVARDAARAEMELAARIRKDDEDYDMGRDTATLLANNASLMKDAARYRWLRSGKNTAVADEMFSRCCEDHLDGEIDAALKSCGEV